MQKMFVFAAILLLAVTGMWLVEADTLDSTPGTSASPAGAAPSSYGGFCHVIVDPDCDPTGNGGG